MSTTKSFLYELAEEIYNSQTDLSKVTVVFPNRRAALYFRKYLSEQIDKPVFAPQLLTFEDFVSTFSPLQVPDKLELVFRLHQCYRELMQNDEPFDQFFMWGEMLLRDFDEVDRYLVDPKFLFADLSHFKEMDSGLDYLTDEQREFLETFWQGFDADTSVNKKKFIDVWKKLYPLYQKFNEQLSRNNFAYEGHLHRTVAEDLLSGKIKTAFEKNQLWFAGFNALTKAEEKIISFFIEQGVATARWDADQYYFNDERQEAGVFFRHHKQDLILGKTFSSDLPNHFREIKNMQLFSAAQPIGQVKLLAQLLEQELKNGMIPEETVIILPDEKMLMPVLHSISPLVEKFNVTMGFSLMSSPVYNLIELLIELQIAAKKNHFSYRTVHSVLSHPYIVAIDVESAFQKTKEITDKNWVTIPEEFLQDKVELHKIIFTETEKITSYLLEIFQTLILNSSLDDLDREYIAHTIKLLNRLDAIGENVEEETARVSKLKNFLRLFRQYFKGEKLPFVGEPLKGLQVMGVLESRNLDFKNVFILSLNEGVFPSSSQQGSYIPFSIRKAYSLPTLEHQGAIYAYLFFRAMQRSQNVFLFYNSEPDALGQGEMSRYLQQLIYESGFPLKENKHVLHNAIQPRVISTIEIEKDEHVLQLLAKLNEGNTQSKGISPSALSTYLECALKFYFQYVIRIREANEVQEEIDPRILGNLLHSVMENFYKKIIEKKSNSEIDTKDFEGLEKTVDGLIDEAFIENYNLNPKQKVVYEGQRVVIREVLKKFSTQILKYDKQYAPFQIIALERKDWTHQLKINHAPNVVLLGGTIDRVDKKENEIRIIDYKTGKDELGFTDVESLFDRENSKRNKAAFQTLLYALLYKTNTETSQKIIPGLLNRKNLFDDDFQFGLIMAKQPLTDATPLLDEFEEHLTKLLEDIFNPSLKFNQTQNEKTCEVCPYKGICSR